MTQEKLEARIREIQNSSKLTEKEKEWATEDYLKYQERSGAESPSTQERYLRWIKRILEDSDFNVNQLQEMTDQELSDVNEEIVDKIQSSHYREEDGDLVKRNKRGYWTAWKRALETVGLSSQPHEDYIPSPVKWTEDEEKVQRQANTAPGDLPNPDQLQEFLKTLEAVSSKEVALRNKALVLFIWDAGTRIGETLPLQMKQISVNGDRLHVKVEGNKKAENRRIEIFQGKQTLIDYIENHPRRNDPEAYLFCALKDSKYHTVMEKDPLRKKIHQAKEKADVDFKTYGEPFHIFRKAMTTYYVVNEILTWEEVCERQGKSPDSTMPTYLKMAMQDIDSSAAEGFGLDNEEREMEHRMRAAALLSQGCQSCGKQNHAYRETCQDCGTQLPEGEMPGGEAFEQEEVVDQESVGILREMAEEMGMTVEEFKERFGDS
ncbi:MAG: tyrosine-type recombinase/integrase [Candidatus Nanohaloarchaea archaeon]